MRPERAAQVPAVKVAAGLGQPPSQSIVCKRIGVKKAVLRLPKPSAMIIARAAFGDKSDLRRPFGTRVGGKVIGGNGGFLKGALAKRGGREKARRKGSEALKIVVGAVDRNIYGGIGQVVVGRVALVIGIGGSRDKRDKFQEATAGKRKVFDECRTDRAGQRIFRGPRHLRQCRND